MNLGGTSIFRAKDQDGIDAAASQWVVRQRAGLDDSGARELARWRAGDPRHEDAFQRLDAMSATLQRARDCGAMHAIGAGLAVRSRRRRTRRTALGAVALAILIGVSTHAYLRHDHDRVTPMASVAGSTFPRLRHLPDGSTVELNGDSDVAVHFNSAARGVELLRGEALFHVAKDPLHPFIVRAAGVNVQAVGTAFSVRLKSTQVEVLVTEGQVGLNNALQGRSLLPTSGAGQPATLVAGQRAIVADADPSSADIASVSSLEADRWLAWRTPRVDYDGTELGEAVRQMNERNRVKITLRGGIGRLRISGSFPADNPRIFARLAAETFGLKYEELEAGAIVLREP